MNLSELRNGQRATVLSFENDEISIKLMEMGFIPGDIVYIEKVAPLGDPISIFVSGYVLSLRLEEAKSINVELLTN